MRRLLLPLLGATAGAVVLGLVLGHDDPPRPAAPDWPYPPHLVSRPDDGRQPPSPLESRPGQGQLRLLPPADGSAPVYRL
jgi:hypothetical protein